MVSHTCTPRGAAAQARARAERGTAAPRGDLSGRPRGNQGAAKGLPSGGQGATKRLLGCGEADEERLVCEFERVSNVFMALPAGQRAVISDITRRMGCGMALVPTRGPMVTP